MNVKEMGYYTLVGTSNFRMTSHLYKNSFDPNDPVFDEHLIKDVYCSECGFRQNIQLQSTMIYILVIAMGHTVD